MLPSFNSEIITGKTRIFSERQSGNANALEWHRRRLLGKGSDDHMDAKHLRPLPEFESPPVSEVALSIEFLPLPAWRVSHAGLYWSHIRKDYPHTDVQPPIPSQIEKFGEGLWQPPLLRFEISNPDVTRSWFITEDRTRLIQIQRDRFVINWRKVHGDEVYPRYDREMRPRFELEWGHFK